MDSIKGQTEIKYEGKVLISCNTFITFGSGETSIDFNYEGDHIRLIVQFEGEETDPAKQKIDTKIIDKETMKLTFVNFNSVLGSYTKNPTDVGIIAGRKIWISWVARALQKSNSKVFTYSLYAEEKTINATTQS